jgi:hypothetical protein
MTFKKNNNTLEKMLDGIELSVETNRQVFLEIKYDDSLRDLAVCISSYHYHQDRYVCDLCKHKNCNNILGFIGDYDEKTLLTTLHSDRCWIIESDSGWTTGKYLQSTGIPGVMEVSDNVSRFKVGTPSVSETENVMRTNPCGYDRKGLIFEYVKSEDENPIFDRYPKTRFIDSTGALSQEFLYYADIKRCSKVIKPLNLSGVKTAVQQTRFERLTKPTALTTQRGLLKRTNSTTSVGSVGMNRFAQSKNGVEPTVDTIKRSIYKICLFPVF